MVGIRMAMVPTQMAKRLLCTFHYVQMQQEVVTYNLESSPLLDPWPLPSPQDHNAIWCFASYSVYSVLLQQPKQDKMTMCLSCWLWYPFLCDYVTASAGILWVNRKTFRILNTCFRKCSMDHLIWSLKKSFLTTQYRIFQTWAFSWIHKKCLCLMILAEGVVPGPTKRSISDGHMAQVCDQRSLSIPIIE